MNSPSADHHCWLQVRTALVVDRGDWHRHGRRWRRSTTLHHGTKTVESFQRIWPVSRHNAEVWESRPVTLPDLEEIASAWREGSSAEPTTLTPG